MSNRNVSEPAVWWEWSSSEIMSLSRTSERVYGSVPKSVVVPLPRSCWTLKRQRRRNPNWSHRVVLMRNYRRLVCVPKCHSKVPMSVFVSHEYLLGTQVGCGRRKAPVRSQGNQIIITWHVNCLRSGWTTWRRLQSLVTHPKVTTTMTWPLDTPTCLQSVPTASNLPSIVFILSVFNKPVLIPATPRDAAQLELLKSQPVP